MKVERPVHLALPEIDELDGLLPSLGWLGAGLMGGPLAVAETSARTRRTIVTPDQVLVSRQALEDGGVAAAPMYRAALAHAVAHCLFSPLRQPARLLKPMSQAVVAAIEDVRVERLLARRYPGVVQWFLDNLAPVPEAGNLGFEAFISRMDRALTDPGYADDNHWVNKARRLFEETQTRFGLLDHAAFRAAASILANDLGQMRVRFDPQHYVVPSPYRDDNSVLWVHEEDELDEQQSLSLSNATPARATSPPPTGDTQSDSLPEVEIETGRYLHPEWHHRLALWRRDWCTVIEKLPVSAPVPRVRAHPAATRIDGRVLLQPMRRLSRRQRLRRQWEGDDIDLNAAIEVLVDRRMDLEPEPRLFMRPGRERGTSSILVLLDLSESTNDPSGTRGTSLLDIEKQASFLLAEAISHTQDRLAIHGFCSNTRAEVSYYRLLDWDDPIDSAAYDRLASVQARHSTRLGAALRHASSHLQAQQGRYRGILIVTDGAPSDVDVFDPEHLVEDARMAVQQAHRAGIRTFCLSVDPTADRYVRRIFGWRDHCIADDPRHLPLQLQRAYFRLAGN
jgi:nitric oxide reductase NorD protein